MFKTKNESNIVYKCSVRLLEDADILECEFQPFHKGSYLLEYLCQQLGIKEKDYFGLRYVDSGKQRHWLDLAKLITKQCKEIDPVLFSFRVKFYPADPFRLTGNGRLMLYQQLKRDLRHGRLYCSTGEAAALGSLVVQEELGDYDDDVHIKDYVSSMNLVLRQTDALEKKIMELHRNRGSGQDSTVAMDEFLGIARDLETYGIDPHPVKDHRGSQLYVGVNHTGISTFVSGKRSQHFRWNEIHKLNFENKMFIAHLSYTDASREPKKHTIGFKCSSGAACRYLWRCAIEQMLFFTLPNSQNASVVSGGGFFSWGTKFKYTGRTEREILTESISALREQKMTNSAISNRKASSVPATPSSPQGDLAQIRYCSLPRSTMSEPLSNCITADIEGNLIYGSRSIEGVGGSSLQIPNLETVSEESRLRVSNLNSLNNATCNIPDYWRRDSEDLSSAESSLTNQNIFADGLSRSMLNQRQPNITNKHYLNIASKQRAVIYPKSSNMRSTSTDMKHDLSNISTASYHVDKVYDSMVRRENTAKRAKIVRKFRPLHVFIPSFLFVAILMGVSAIFIMESDSELLGRIQSTPEMITLRYQYYQPLKEFILRYLRLNL